MSVFFDVAYGLVIFLAGLAAGSIPGFVLGLLVPIRDRRWLMAPAYALAVAGWVWFGLVEGTYGISRLGLAAFCAVAAAGFVRGWLLGLQAGRKAGAAGGRSRAAAPARARYSRTPASRR